MRFAAVICSLGAAVSALVGQPVDAGTGAPDDAVRAEFVAAFNRGSFSRIASLPPAGAVRRFGATGLIQEFTDSTRAAGRLALVKATSTASGGEGSGNVYQVQTDVYAYYSTVGVSTAGYPTGDTQSCLDAPCTWQLFDRNVALFAWFAGANDPENITVRDSFFARWIFYGGMGGPGAAVSAETDVTSRAGTTAKVQIFRHGVIFSISSGALSGSVLTVREPIRSLYEARGGYGGSLGFPSRDEVTLANGRRRQEFEGGVVEYDDNSGPVLRVPVSSVTLRGATSPVRLTAGESIQIEAVVHGSDGTELTDRQVNFLTSNGRVATVQATGRSATVRAAGGGNARITATAEGRTSDPLEVIVDARCCAIGEGAPTAAIQSAFQAAVARARIQIRLPGPEPVRRVASGYVQEFEGADGRSRYLLAMSDRSGQAWVVTGALLNRYEALGGTASAPGFPAGDATPGGRQVFERGALAGNPVRLVAGAIFTRWASSGYEAGPAGLPLDEVVTAMSFSGTSGQVQPFEKGSIAAAGKGAFLVTGRIADRWAESGGAEGTLGYPTGEETSSGESRSQEFEGGRATVSSVSTDVQITAKERRPAVSANPAAAVAGGRVRLTVWGFAARAVLRVSVTGQPDFVAPTVTGAFTWEAPVPLSAAAGAVRVRAVDIATGALAEGSFTVRAASEVRFRLTVAAGDGQTGAPGAPLPAPLSVQVRDDSGAPVPNMTIRFAASPGAKVSPAAAPTDSSGIASTWLTLPEAAGVAVVTAEGGRQVVTFAGRSVESAIRDFPGQVRDEHGALVAALSSTIRYYQNRGAAGTPNGAATPAELGAFLRRFCLEDSRGEQVCDGTLRVPGTDVFVPNIWRVPRFADGNVELTVEAFAAARVRASLAGGSPLIIAMRVTSDGIEGSHFVVATGIASDGSIEIHDPDPELGRTRLSEYTAGFERAGRRWQGDPAAAIRLAPGKPPRGAFSVMTWGPAFGLRSRSGECGSDVAWPALPPGSHAAPQVLRQRYCEGSEAEYQLEINGQGVRAALLAVGGDGARTELSGGGDATFRVAPPGPILAVQPQRTRLAATPVLNAASFTAAIAPGSLVSVFGTGLWRSGTETRVTVGGRVAPLVFASPFQLNVQVPPETPPGLHALRVEGAPGTDEGSIEVQPAAPAVFAAGGGWSIVNADGRLNSTDTPAKRGDAVIVYGTGFGAVSAGTTMRTVLQPVSAWVRTQELQITYAGLAPGLTGVYQINCVIPVTVAPGLQVPLVFGQAGYRSEPVEISIF